MKLWLRTWLVIVGLLALAGCPALAAQGNTVLPVTGAFGGLQEQQYINSAFDAAMSCSIGPTAPANATGAAPVDGQCWINNSNSALWIKNVFDGVDWLPEGYIDTVDHIWIPALGGGLPPTIASGSTTDLGSHPQGFVLVSGNATISGFGSTAPPGSVKFVEFTGTPTLVDSSSIILPGGGNLAVASGGAAATILSLGSGNWLVENFESLGSAGSSGTGLPVLQYSPTLTGAPAAPTQTAGDDSTDIATDQFVQTALAGTAQVGFLRGLKILNSSSTAFVASATAAVLSNGTNALQVSTTGVTCNTGSSGAGGLDTGSLAASTWYAVYFIDNGSTLACIFSLSATAPTLPSGYTYALRIGWIVTNASKALIPTNQVGNHAEYVSPQTVASGFVPSVTAINATGSGGFAPPTAYKVEVILVIGWDHNDETATLGANATSYVMEIYSVDEGIMYFPTSILLQSTNIYWSNSLATGTYVADQGWDDLL